MKKVLIIFFFIQCVFVGHVYSYDVNDVLDSKTQEELRKTFELVDMEIDVPELINKFNKGEFKVESNNIFNAIINILKNEFFKTFGFIVPIFVIIMLSALTDNLNTSFNNNELTGFIIKSILVLNLINIAYEIIEYSIQMIDRLILFINSLIPTLMGLLATSGNVNTAGVLNPVMIGVSSIISLVIKSFIVPLSLIGLAVKITGEVTGKVYLGNFGNQVQKVLKWSLGIVFTIYVGIIGIVGVVTPKIDNITLKTTKYVVGNFIPYVGGMVADSVELILTCSAIVKNSVGVLGLVGIISIVGIPCIKIAVKVITINIFSLIVSPVTGKPTINIINYISDCFSMFLGMDIVVSIMYILSITVIIFAGGA